MAQGPELLSIDLAARLRLGEFEVIPASEAITDRIGRLDWAYRDPFDRSTVAAALERALPVVSLDGTLDEAPSGGPQRAWSER